MIKLHNVDCMEYLATCEDNAFELAIVDPPYGIDAANKFADNSTVKHTSKDWDKNIMPPEFFEELDRVSTNQIIWGGNYMVAEIGKNSSCWLVWDKNNGASTFADGELAYTSFKSPVRIKKIHWCGSAAIHETGQNKIHPTQKPVKLYEWLLMNYAKDGDRILDTHLGSGSIALACHNLGFDLVGCELDEDYYNAACKRLKQHQAQQRMF